jgi:hypothetical protein
MTSTHEVWGKLQTKANSYEIAVGEELACYLFCIIAQTASASNTTIGLCRQITQHIHQLQITRKTPRFSFAVPRVSSKLLPGADCCKWYILSTASFSHAIGGNISCQRKYGLETNFSLVPPGVFGRESDRAHMNRTSRINEMHIQYTDYKQFSTSCGPQGWGKTQHFPSTAQLVTERLYAGSCT